MVRTEVFSACLAVSALWWGGYGDVWWRLGSGGRRCVALIAFLVGVSGWVPSPHAIAIGNVLVSGGSLGIALSRGRWHWGGWLVLSAAGLLRISGAWPGKDFWFLAALLGLVGAILSADPPIALALAASSQVVAGCLGLAWHGMESLALNRSQLAMSAASGLCAWGASVVLAGARRARSRHRRRI